MPTLLFDNGPHRNVVLEDYGSETMVQVNQHLVISGGEAVILDPGGHKSYGNLLTEVNSRLGSASLKYIFLSHQDPDVVASCNALLHGTKAVAYISAIWTRFLPHMGIDPTLITRLKAIPDAGMALPLGGADLLALPAHFLHSPGNFHLFDPVSKILYSGDLGASFGADYMEVTDFDAHVQYMEGFHVRFMASNKALRAWVALARTLDVEILAPQHGAWFKGKPSVSRFLNWAEGLACGVDRLPPAYLAPPGK